MAGVAYSPLFPVVPMDLNLPQIILAMSAGIGLAAAVGFRVFVPMLLAGLAAKTGHLHLAGGFEWLASDIALVMLTVAALAEVAAYFVPFFDHLLDSVSGPVAVAAGTMLMASTLIDMEPWLRWVLALVAGGGTAGMVHAGSAGLRAGSTATTGGLANPMYAGFELGASTFLTILAIAVPVLALAVTLFIVGRLARLMGRGWRRLRHRGS